ncbi:MAG: GGDEF domain-containing protein [Campylobacterales bacterium]|nr:GGDEF domain-containing protein [Campylobacterales bacterium]
MYTESIERVQRFKLALRMGIPVFMLAGILLFSVLMQYFEKIPYHFIVIVVGVLAVAVYFQFYLIYRGFKERVTENITHTFTRDYFQKLFLQHKARHTCTLILFTIQNFADINERLGYRKGDRILYTAAQQIDFFLTDRGVKKPIISHFKGGTFLLLLDGNIDEYRILFEHFLVRMGSAVLDGVEIKGCGAIIDTETSGEFEQLVERLFELQAYSSLGKILVEDDKTDLNTLENEVLDAIRSSRLSMRAQEIDITTGRFFELTFKLIDSSGHLIHQNRFFPIVLRLGLIAPYMQSVLAKTYEIASTYPQYRFALEIPAELLRQRDFSYTVTADLTLRSIQNLIFVLQEKEYFSNIKRFEEILQSYRHMGIGIALDGYGSNHTTLLYLKDLHVDFIRFEGSFGKKFEDERYRALIEGLHVSAKRLGVKTWLRMIEDQKSVQAAKAMGIDLLSGNILGTIAPIETLIRNES